MRLTQNLKCATCKTPLSYKWLFLSRRSQKYTCPVCKTEYEWSQSTASKDVTSIFFGIAAIMYISSRYSYLPLLVRYGIGAVVMAGILVGFTLFASNQFTIRPKN
jgi:uncharacterized paraquat-inducible protein A